MKNQIKKAVASSLAFVLIVCAAFSGALPAFAAQEDELYIEGTYDYKNAYEVLSLVNSERTAQGLSELKMDAALLEAAMQRAAEISILFEHTRPNGEPCVSVMPSASKRAENIAAGQYSAGSVMNSWMSSNGHKANILGEFSSVGIGCFVQNGCYHWVQLFSSNAPKTAAVSENKTVTASVKTSSDFQANYTLGASSKEILIGETAVCSLKMSTGFFDIALLPSSADWSSSDPSVAEVDKNGVITAKGSGTARITSNLCGVETSIEITAHSVLEYVRLGGSDRVDTAVKISQKGWTKADNVILASGVGFADALAGVPLAYALNAPILLTNGTKLESNVVEQIKALGVKNIYILGGVSAVSGPIEAQLTLAGYRVTRLWGEDRYATAIEIAKTLGKITGGSDTVFFTRGSNYPDALSISAVAALTGSPILYAPSSGSLDGKTAQYIIADKAYSAVIIGGESAISKEVASQIKNSGFSVSRISGGDRYATSLAVCEAYNGLFTDTSVAFATGRNFPDALAGAAFAAKLGTPVLLTDNSSAKPAAKKYLSEKEISTVYIFGGNEVVSDKIIDAHFNN